jgi:hypothetical protein
MGEPAGVVASVLTRASAAGATGQVNAILAELARRGEETRWLARLWHIAPEPAGTGGRRPDLVDRYLGHVVRHRSPSGLVALCRELAQWSAGPGAAFRLVEILREPDLRWARLHIVHLLTGPGEAWLAAELSDGGPGETREPACAAAVAEVRQRLAGEDEPPAAGPAQEREIEQWSAEFSPAPGEVPLRTIYLGEPTWGSVIGLSDRGLHYRFRRGPGRPGPVATGGESTRNEFFIPYPSFAELTFSADDSKIKVRRQPSADLDVAKGYWWPVESASEAELDAAVRLLNRMALAVRTVQAVRLDEPLGATRPR